MGLDRNLTEDEAGDVGLLVEGASWASQEAGEVLVQAAIVTMSAMMSRAMKLLPSLPRSTCGRQLLHRDLASFKHLRWL